MQYILMVIGPAGFAEQAHPVAVQLTYRMLSCSW